LSLPFCLQVWEVDSGGSLNPGDSVSATVETGPKDFPQEWQLVYYPRGFVDPAVASFFVTNVGLHDGKPLPHDRQVSATVSVTVLPVEESASIKSTGKKPGGNKGSKGKNDAPLEVCRKLSKTFGPKSHTFGFESFADRDILCGRNSRFLHGSDGMLHLHISISVSAGAPLNPPEVDDEVRESGWQRVKWLLGDFKGLIQNTPPGSKLSSPHFRVNGEWYLDIYPSGYRGGEPDEPACVSVYLHSSKRQSDRGDKIKRRLRFGLERLNPLPQAFYSAAGEDATDDVCWASAGEVVAIFSSEHRSAGCRSLVPHAVLSTGRRFEKALLDKHRVTSKLVISELVAGKFDKGGSVKLVLDMLVSDQVEGQVQQGLRLTQLPSSAGVWSRS